MALDSFIPSVWSGVVLDSLKKQHIFAQPNVANRDYQGDITQFGDTVKIHSVGPVTVFDVTKNTDIPDPHELTGAETTLVIDKQKGFNFQVDDIDQAQSRIKDVLSRSMVDAAYRLASEVDDYCAQLLVDNVPAANVIGSTGTPETLAAATEAYEYLIDLKTILDEANVPMMGRWVAVPAWYVGQLLRDDRFVANPTGGATNDALLNGSVGRAAGFDVLSSNSIIHEGTGASGEYFEIVAGTNWGLSFAEQIVKVEAYRMEKRFADAIKGLHVWGAKVVRPEVLAMLIVDRP